ncbi:hypothetical protein [Neobacillus jeddahensis]|uniref:hypothetical protein n=1 Tax=Neobacillus jeddahensis TaxID=1461580 RepID=UPI0005A8C067|nr:hypothetical protein [Neobacillus jeddahensis]
MAKKKNQQYMEKGKSWVDYYNEDQKKKEEEKKQGKVRFREASAASRPQYTLSGYQGQSEKENYKWEKNLLKDLDIKGKSYNDKFSNWAKSQGMSDYQAYLYRREQDFKEDSKQKYKLNDDGTLNKKQSIRLGQGAHTNDWLMNDILKNMNKRAEAEVRKNNKESQKSKNEPFFTDVKNFFTGKDTDGDGKPNGLFRALEIIDRPGDAVRTGIKEKVEGNSFWKGAEDGFLGNKDTSGEELNRTLGFDPETDKKDEKIANVIGKTVMDMGVTKFITPFVPSNIRTKVGTVITGMGSEMLLDPLNLMGAGLGKGASKGLQLASNQAMKNLLLEPKQVEQALLDSTKLFKSEQALPIKGGFQNPGVLQDLIPKGNDIAKPSLLPKLKPKTKFDPVVPKIGPSLDELPKLRETSLFDRSLLLGEKRSLPDFSTAKPTIEKNSMLANMLPDAPRTIPDFSYGKQTSEPIPPVNQYGVEVPFDKVEHAPADYWRGRYEEFSQFVNENYNSNQLSKEALDDLWTQFAKYDEPVTLEQVVDLAYPSTKEAPVLDARNVKIKRQPASNKAKAILGLNDSAFKPPEPGKPIDAADVWDKMGKRKPASNKAKNLLLGELKPKQKTLQPLSELLPKLKPKDNPQFDNLVGGLKPNLLEHLNPAGLNNSTKFSQTLDDLLPRLPESPSSNLKERGHINTLRNSENTSMSLKERLQGAYKPTTNEEAVLIANNYLAQGAETATSFVKNAKVLKPEHVATAHRLIQEFQRSGQIDKAVDIAEHIAERGTKAGQAVQAFSIFDRLSPEGILVHANRVADRVNAKLNPLQQKVVITNETATQLTDLATTVQKMTQQKTVANDVINLLDRAKAGEKLSEAETKELRQFVDDAKQWITDITPKRTKSKGPNKIIKPEVKEQVVKFLDKQEEAARKRLAARKGRALSGLPVDDFYDYAVIGASKLAKETINFAEFSEQMIREFGEEIRPHIQQVYDKSSEMVTNEFKRTTNRLSEVEKITNKALKNGKLEEVDAENLRNFAISINNMSGDAKIEASQELQATLQLLERPSLLQKISTTQTIGQLLNPKTLGRNAIGNEMFYRLERINKLVATPIDITRAKLTGGQRTVTFRTHNQGEYWKNWLRGWKAGLKGVNPEGISTQYDLRPNTFNGKWNPMKYFERTLGATLKSFDYAGYKRAVNNTVGELANLRALNEGLTGQARNEAIQRYIREADENILAIADQYGKYVTFQDNNIFSTSLQKVKNFLNGGKDWGAGDIILKYPRTPGSLLMRALEYSPAGFLKTAYAIAKPFFNKQFAWNEVIESFTRATIGTGMTGIAWFMADKGILTGVGSKDFDVQEVEKSSGKAQYSLNLDALARWVFSGFNSDAAETQDGDTFVSYNWAQPIATALSLGGNAQTNVKESGEPNLFNAAYAGIDGAAETMIGTSVLQGLKKAATSYPGQSGMDKAIDIAGDIPASFVPTLFNQVRQATDNTTRNTYDPSKPQMFINRMKNKVPGLAGASLPAAYDSLGNKKEVYQGKSNNLFNVFLNPAFVSRYNPSSEAQMVLDVINDTGDTTAAPRRAQKYMRSGGKTYYLTTEQYSEYQRSLGEEVSLQLQDLDPTQDSETLALQINKVLDRAGKKVRDELKEEFFGNQ